GQSGIFTQTTSDDTIFDSSDQGKFGNLPPTNLEPNNAAGNGNTNLIGGCSSNASFITPAQLSGPCNPLNAPVITFKENGNAMTFTDSGFILNTGEWDFVNNTNFKEDGNESINWNSLGGTSRGGNSPEPATLVLVGSGLFVAGFVRKRSKKA
ncbi:MAG: PEP-CTERM sorting domain-containing protein, partial [Bryobacteraceae bacterium]